ncbi:MAG: hypothetical protein KAU06_00320 [Candidatus Marinimicrobia bacterium]|nr:hypothetical protein [Candidatus Neomarinimicrobiota bacterium]
MKKPTVEPLRYFVEKYGFDISEVDKVVCGTKYSALLLKNGNIGVCANLSHNVVTTIDYLKNLDLNRVENRIVLNAYLNGKFNYSNRHTKAGDIFDAVNFKNYKNIVMIGLFKPLLKKFREKNISVSVFDRNKKSSCLTDIALEMSYINEADALILSSTTIFNKSFLNIVNNMKRFCDVFLLGPSSIMNKDILKYRNVNRVFGAVFSKGDERVLDVIKHGGGTREFLPLGEKIYI